MNSDDMGEVEEFISSLNAYAEWWDRETGVCLTGWFGKLIESGVSAEAAKNIMEGVVATIRTENETMHRRVSAAMADYSRGRLF